MESFSTITIPLLSEFREEFYGDPKNVLSLNVISRSDPLEGALTRSALEKSTHVFTHKIPDEGKPVTDQKTSGRCWIFAALNAMRIPFMKKMELDDFEFSQSYVFYFDKIERCNYFLNNVVNVIQRGESVEGRLMSFLLSDVLSDGGQWDMFVSLIEKYGLMPKKCFPESYSSENTVKMNRILRSKLREFTRNLMDRIKTKASHEELSLEISRQMKILYRIIGICLGIPSSTFIWEYVDKLKKYHKIGPLSPLEFYQKHVKTIFDCLDQRCLVSDPRPQNPFGKTYTVDCLGNVVGGRSIIYNNQEIEKLIGMAAKSIIAGCPVWFGCEVIKDFVNNKGILDTKAFDTQLLFGTNVNLGMSKADRLTYGNSMMTHAMLLTGVHLDENDEPTKWRVENSWGKDRHEDGYIVMTTDWFREFVFEIVVDKKFISQDVLDVFTIEPVTLPAWDPMGALA